jgi:WS/DGAT/MGAT family acyltransferase
MHVAALAVIDPSSSDGRFSYDALRALTSERLPSMPQFRWRLVDVPLGVDRPGWVEAEQLDLDYHIRRVSVPPPGAPGQLDDLVATLVSTKLDRSRPLWEMFVIDGLHDGRVAVLTKVHHSLIDGISGAGLTEIIMDITPEPRAAPAAATDAIGGDAPHQLQLLARGALRTAVRTPIRLARFGAQSVRQGVSAVTRLGQGDGLALPYTAPRTHLNGEFTSRRVLARATLSMDRVQSVKNRINARSTDTGAPATRLTLNDLVLALVAGALRDYLVVEDDLPEQPLVVQVPVSLRSDADRNAVGSKVGSMFASLATHLEDPIERLHAIRESTAAGKALARALGEHRAIGVTETVSPGLLGLAARVVTAMHLERAPSAVNLVVSNVPGPQMPLFMCGAPVEGFFPMGPLLLGMGVNITVFSHDRQIDVGVFACPDLVADPKAIADRFEDALVALETALAAV